MFGGRAVPLPADPLNELTALPQILYLYRERGRGGEGDGSRRGVERRREEEGMEGKGKKVEGTGGQKKGVKGPRGHGREWEGEGKDCIFFYN